MIHDFFLGLTVIASFLGGGGGAHLTVSTIENQETGSSVDASYSMQEVHAVIFREEAKDFRELSIQEAAFEEFLSLHRSWEDDYQSLILKQTEETEAPIHIGELFRDNYIEAPYEGATNPGIMYQSGIHYDTYQNHLRESIDQIKKANDALSETLRMACTICIAKQRIPLQNCPIECFQLN